LTGIQFGKPGSGKGTLSSKLIAKYDVSQLSAGDILRTHILERSVPETILLSIFKPDSPFFTEPKSAVLQRE
jgi:hypothetical protein